MTRTLTALLCRDPSRDRQDDRIQYQGYRVCWPDGRRVGVGLDAFCKHGQRLLGLNRHMANVTERLVDLIFCPLRQREDPLTRIPGARVRRFLLVRGGRQGRIHFLDGTPTAVVFDLDRDEVPVLNWIGLADLADGESQWFDLAARPADSLLAVETVA